MAERNEDQSAGIGEVVPAGISAPDTTTMLRRLTGASLLATLVLVSFYEIDLIVSGWFFVRDTQFTLTSTKLIYSLAEGFRDFNKFLSFIVPVGILAVLLLSYVLYRSGLRPWRRRCAYLLLAFAIGPGLIVNGILKEHWDRARPSHIEEFGGDKTFTPVVMRADQCETNCSFPSGEGAIAFATFAFALIVARRRGAIMAAALTYGVVASAVRVLQGGHFFSDVVFSAIVALFTCLYLYRWVFERDAVFVAFSSIVEKYTAPILKVFGDQIYKSQTAKSVFVNSWLDRYDIVGHRVVPVQTESVTDRLGVREPLEALRAVAKERRAAAKALKEQAAHGTEAKDELAETPDEAPERRD